MKKIISVLLTVIMLFSLCGVAASAGGDELVITVANDLHYNLNYTQKEVEKHGNKLNADFAHVGSTSRLPHEAAAIIDAFFRDVAANDSDYVIIPGDITDSGLPTEVAGITAIFREFEAKSGKKIYVTPGNHDVLKSTKAQFVKDYYEFGFDEAIEMDTDSASYVVDLNDEYRLIAIDTTTEGDGAHSMNEKLLNWITKQGEKAKADGKKLIAMHHHNLLEHMILSGVVQPNAVVTAKNPGYAEVYAKAGIKYTFTGHTHDHDIASYTAEDGSVIYDAVTGSLNAYGTLYRVVTFGKNVKFETKGVEKIDISLLPGCISDNAKALAESDFFEYQRIATNLSFEIVFNTYTTAKGLKSVLKLEDEEMNAIIDKIADRLNKVLNMPLEKEDETVKGESIESIVEKYNTTIPDTEYRNMIDLTVNIYQAHNLGDENFPAYSDEVILFTRGIAATLGYALSEVTAQEYAKVISFITALLGVEIPVDFLYYAGDGIKRFEGIEILVTTAILPAVAEFTTDNAPADRDVTLPGYAELVEENEPDFFQKVINFFKMIYATVRTLLAFLPEWK